MKEKIIPKKDTTGKVSDEIRKEEKPPYSRSVNGWLDDVEKIHDSNYRSHLFKLV